MRIAPCNSGTARNTALYTLITGGPCDEVLSRYEIRFTADAGRHKIAETTRVKYELRRGRIMANA